MNKSYIAEVIRDAEVLANDPKTHSAGDYSVAIILLIKIIRQLLKEIESHDYGT